MKIKVYKVLKIRETNFQTLLFIHGFTGLKGLLRTSLFVLPLDGCFSGNTMEN